MTQLWSRPFHCLERGMFHLLFIKKFGKVMGNFYMLHDLLSMLFTIITLSCHLPCSFLLTSPERTTSSKTTLLMTPPIFAASPLKISS